MSEETTTNKKADEKAEVQPEIEETQPSESAENESADSTLEITENPTNDVKKKRFGYKWILIGLGLISIVLFIIYFGNIKDFFLADESRIYVIGGVIVALVVGSLVWYVPKRQVKKLAIQSSGEKLTDFEREKERLKLEDDTRKTLAQLVGGVFLIAGLFVTYNTYRLGTDTYRLGLEQQKINTRGQITDRFNKAIDHLGSENLSIRLGGLYALEQILKDSSEEHQTIIEVLCAYIREKAKKPEIKQDENINKPMEVEKSVPIDVQTAITILVRRPKGQNESQINLQNTNLRKADFTGADLRLADFSRANLTQAILIGTYLGDANFSYANLGGANLRQADLADANFDNVYISEETLLYDFQLKKAEFVNIFISDGKFDREAALKELENAEAEILSR